MHEVFDAGLLLANAFVSSDRPVMEKVLETIMDAFDLMCTVTQVSPTLPEGSDSLTTRIDAQSSTPLC